MVDGVFLKWDLRFQFIVGHVPTEADASGAKDEFWDALVDLHSKLQQRSPTAKRVLPIDANARVGSVPAPCFGPCQPELENDNGHSGLR